MKLAGILMHGLAVVSLSVSGWSRIGELLLARLVRTKAFEGCTADPRDEKEAGDVRSPVPHVRRAAWLINCGVYAVCANTGCGDPTVTLPGEVAGIMVAGGQNAAFLGDTVVLSLWYRDNAGRPLGVAPADPAWSTSDPSTLDVLYDSVFVARAVGTATVRAVVEVDDRVFETSIVMHALERPAGFMAWARQDGNVVRINTGNLSNTTAPQQLAFGHPSAGHALPAVSPNGRFIAAQSSRPSAVGARSAIYVVDLQTSEVWIATDSMPGDQISARWSPSGTELLFASSSSGAWDLWSISLADSSVRKRVQLGAGFPVFFDLDRNSGRIVAALVTPGLGQDLFWVALDTGIVGRVTNTPEDPKSNPRIRPDGKAVAYTGPVGEADGVLVVQLGGGLDTLAPETRVPRGPGFSPDLVAAHLWVGAWSPDGKYLVASWLVDPFAGGAGSESWSYPFELYAFSSDGQYRVRLTRSIEADVQADVR